MFQSDPMYLASKYPFQWWVFYSLAAWAESSTQNISLPEGKYIETSVSSQGKNILLIGFFSLIWHGSKTWDSIEELMVDWDAYQRLVGKLIYLSYTRLDIAYAVSVVS